MAQSSSTEQQPEPHCQIEMQDGKPCGRPVYLSAHDEEPVCLMHSKDPEKSNDAFQAEFERILTEAEHENTVADFQGFIFPAANYSGRTFLPKCNFIGATFTQKADFCNAIFTQDADFSFALFAQETDFNSAIFEQDAYFVVAAFMQYTSFEWVTFTRKANFRNSTFTQNADFSWATFTDAATFREANFRNDSSLEPGLIFIDVKIAHPEKIEFYSNDLSHALFYNTDVSKIDFTQIEWNHRTKSRFRLFDEVVALNHAWALKPLKNSPDERNYSLIAETYQQLKRNYDAKGDYWTAGHWHYGEMEMKRLHSRCSWKSVRWLGRNFGMAAWYKRLSEYGESYVWPLFWLIVLLFGFSLLYPRIGQYPATGLEFNVSNTGSAAKDTAPSYLNAWNYSEFFRTHPAEHPQGRWGLFVRGAMTSLSVASFQKELRYMPSDPWGRLLALIEMLFSTILAGLFALAIRRQFKRS